MMYKSLIIVGGIASTLLLANTSGVKTSLHEHKKVGPESTLSETLIALGAPKPKHFIATIDTVLARKGKEIVFNGTTTDENGNKTKRQSKHYVCTNCHNTQREDPDLRVSNPETRLEYISKNGGKLLQGTTLYGMVNRETWYNDDYIKKYGDLVLPARDTLSNAIQLCATACSQGRILSAYELKAVLNYMWSLQYKLGDLNLSNEEYAVLNNAFASHNTDPNYYKSIIEKLKAKYSVKSPATFVYDLSSKKSGVGGDPAKGKMVYDYACLTCHKKGNTSKFVMNYEKTTFTFLKKKIKKSNALSLYNMVRTSTSYETHHNPYMPNFTKERLSEQQLEDLAAFIIEQCN